VLPRVEITLPGKRTKNIKAKKRAAKKVGAKKGILFSMEMFMAILFG
jgi:hypothetical protein